MPKISFPRWVKKNPAMFFGSLLIVLLSIGLLVFRLTTLHPSPNIYELNTLEKLKNISEIIYNPTDFIYILVAKTLSLVLSDLSALRLTSVLFAIIILFNMRFIIKYWYDARTANIAVLTTTTSFWLLSFARVGAPLIMPAFWLSSLIALYAFSKYTKKPNIIKILIVLTASFGMYTPSFIWWIIAIGAILIHKFGFKQYLSKLKTPLLAIPALLITPLIYSCLDTSVLKELVGYSTTSLNPIEFIKNIISYFSNIAIRGTLNPATNLGRLPYLDIFQSFMLAIGITTFFVHRNNMRGKLLLVSPLIFIAVISIFPVDPIKLAILLPIVYISIAAGVNEFINLWLKGFPRNPIGRAAGLIIIAGLISASGYYNIHRYFVAWAQNPDVKAAHQITK